jgi:maltose alpha-D-glucosyltransferase / alpha-amylase
VPNEGDAWAYTLDQLQSSFEEALARPRQDLDASWAGVVDLAGATATPRAAELVGPYLQAVELLGRRTAEMHLALASAPHDPTFAPERFTELDQRSLYQSIRSAAARVLRRLGGSGAGGRADELLAREAELTERLGRLTAGSIAGLRLRQHGDYHLGQVLFTGRDFVIIDFEGEPARPLSERRIKRPPLRDVAGMLRSFDYAADTALHSPATEALSEDAAQRLEPWARRWTRWVSEAFLRSYLETAAGAPFLPRDEQAIDRLLDVLLLEKALYEIAYELDHRPSWAQTPIRGLLDLLDRGAR